MAKGSKRLLGIGAALIVAAVLMVTELVDTQDEFDELLPPDLQNLQGVDAASEYRTAAGYIDASARLPAVSAARSTDLSAASPAPRIDDPFDRVAPRVPASRSAPAQAEPAVELVDVSRLRVTRSGHFGATRTAEEFFDSYYRAFPDSSDDVVRGRIVLALIDGLPARAADEAITVLDRWRAARNAERALGAEADAAEHERVRRAELGDELARALQR